MLWEVTVFRNLIIPFAEEDVQHIYIKQMSIRDGKLDAMAVRCHDCRKARKEKKQEQD